MLPLALSAESLSDSLVLITLDWQTPWLFVRQLQEALEAVRSCVEALEKQKGGAFAAEEGREQGKSNLQASGDR